MHRAHGAQGRSSRASCNNLIGHTCRVWAGVRQPVTGRLVPIRQLSSTRGDLRNNARPRLAPPPCWSRPFRNSTSNVLFRARYHPFASLSTSAHIVAHCSVLDPPAAGIIHQRQRAVRCISRFQCEPHIQLNAYCILSPVEDISTTSRPSIHAP